jgi:hypothetical protein
MATRPYYYRSAIVDTTSFRGLHSFYVAEWKDGKQENVAAIMFNPNISGSYARAQRDADRIAKGLNIVSRMEETDEGHS